MSSLRCLFCNHSNPVGVSFCNACGSPLHLQPCEKCGAVDNRTAANCYKCGAEFPAPAPPDASVKSGADDVDEMLEYLKTCDVVPAEQRGSASGLAGRRTTVPESVADALAAWGQGPHKQALQRDKQVPARHVPQAKPVEHDSSENGFGIQPVTQKTLGTMELRGRSTGSRNRRRVVWVTLIVVTTAVLAYYYQDWYSGASVGQAPESAGARVSAPSPNGGGGPTEARALPPGGAVKKNGGGSSAAKECAEAVDALGLCGVNATPGRR